jgi:hypothetical protein
MRETGGVAEFLCGSVWFGFVLRIRLQAVAAAAMYFQQWVLSTCGQFIPVMRQRQRHSVC